MSVKLTAADRAGNAAIQKTIADGPLNQGDNEAAVKALEEMLTLAGFSVGKPDSRFGSNTTKALKSFQASVGLPATGQLDATTFQKVKSAQLRVRNNPKDYFSLGQAGEKVLIAEKRLRRLGYDVGKVDGVFDSKTSHAVKAFRADQKELKDGAGHLTPAAVSTLAKEVDGLVRDFEKKNKLKVDGMVSTADLQLMKERAANKTVALNVPMIRQPDGVTCGPTALRMVLAYHGKWVSLGPITAYQTKIGDPLWNGSENWALRAAAKHFGFSKASSFNGWSGLKKALAAGKPCVVRLASVINKGGEHYAVITGIKYDSAGNVVGVYMNDPSYGKRYYTKARFNSLWTKCSFYGMSVK